MAGHTTLAPETPARSETSTHDSAVAVYESHAAAEEAIRTLAKSGFDMKKLSIVGRDYSTEEGVVGYYNTALFAAGPLVAWIAGGLEGATVVGGMSALGAGLYGIGIPKDSVLNYETQIKAGKFVVIAHGTRDEVAKSKTILLGAEHHEGKKPNCCA